MNINNENFFNEVKELCPKASSEFTLWLNKQAVYYTDENGSLPIDLFGLSPLAQMGYFIKFFTDNGGLYFKAVPFLVSAGPLERSIELLNLFKKREKELNG